MANPDPEITPPDADAVRPDAIVATGRSDYPNQVNNVLGFPFIFRGALDVRATAINEEMKIAAAKAIAELARETGARGSRRRLWQEPHSSGRLHHPRPVRSAPDGSGVLSRRQGRHGFGRRAEATSRISTSTGTS
jgi:malic enzyme